MTGTDMLRGVIMGVLFALLFVPLIVAESFFFPFITGKNFAFRIVVEIAFALWLILILFRPEYRPQKSWVLFAVAAFVFVIGLATVFGTNPYRSFWSSFERMEGYITHLHLFAYFLMLGSLFTKEKLWRAFFHVSLAVAAVMAVYGIQQYIGAAESGAIGGNRIDGFFGNPIYFAVYMLFHAFIALFYFVRKREWQDVHWIQTAFALGALFYAAIMFLVLAGGSFGGTASVALSLAALYFLFHAGSTVFFLTKKKHDRAVRWVQSAYALFALFFIVVMVLTLTRGAVVGFAAGVLAMLIFYLIWGKGRARRVSMSALLVFALIASFFVAFRDSAFIQETPPLKRIADISLEENTAQARLMVWGIALQGAKERPVLGWGPENFMEIFNKHYDPGMYAQEDWFDRAHNVFLDWLTAGGILGLLAYLSLFLAALYYLLLRPVSTLTLHERSVLVGLFAAYFAQNMFVFDNIGSYLMFFSVLGFVHFHAVQSEHGSLFEKISQRLRIRGGRVVVEERLRALLAALIIVLAGTSLYFWNIKPIAANQTLLEAIRPGITVNERLTAYRDVFNSGTFARVEAAEQMVRVTRQLMQVPDDDIPREKKLQYLSVIDEEMNELQNEFPQNARLLVFHGQLLTQVGAYEKAREKLARAHELSPTKQHIMFDFAEVYLRQGSLEEAFPLFKRAYELEPSYDRAARFYALAAILTERFDLAEDILEEQFGTALYPHEQIAEAYLGAGRPGRAIAIYEAIKEKSPERSEAINRRIREIRGR